MSLMVKVGKMFVCIETVVRVARSAAAPASVDASKVRAMVVANNLSFNEMPPIHVVRLPKISGTRGGVVLAFLGLGAESYF